MGPAGPAGPTGPPGPAGTTGASGAANIGTHTSDAADCFTDQCQIDATVPCPTGQRATGGGETAAGGDDLFIKSGPVGDPATGWTVTVKDGIRNGTIATESATVRTTVICVTP